MPRKKEPAAAPPTYMTFGEIASELRISVESVREKALVHKELAVINVGNGSERAVWRVPRASFQQYCERREAEAAERFAS